MNRAVHERDVVSGMAVFVAVVESGSLAAAARRTGLTPSAVSKQIARLEQTFGAPLLRRTTRAMTVTDAGQLYYERSRAILASLRDVEDELTRGQREPRGRVRVSASLLLGQIHVQPLLYTFLAQHPQVALDVELTDRAVDLVAERIDVAVRITDDPPPSFVGKRVGTLSRVLCASPRYLRAHPAPRTRADLEGHACLVLSGAEAWCGRVEPRLRVSNTVSLHQAALAGLGLAELPRYLVQDDLRARRLVTVLDDPAAQVERGIFVVYPGGPLLPVRVRRVATFLIAGLTKALG